MTRALDVSAIALLLAFTAAMAFNPMDIQAYNALTSAPYAGTFSGNTARLVLAVYLALRGGPALLGLARIPALCLLLLALGFTSLWSVDPLRSLATVIDLALVVAVTVTLRERLGAETLPRLVLATGIAILALSCLAAFTQTPYALMGGDHAGLWRGFFTHKNGFGAFAAILLVLACTLPRLPLLLRLAALALAVLGLAKAGSAAALIAAVLALGTAAALRLIHGAGRHGPMAAVILVTLLACTLVLIIAEADRVLALLHRDRAFSGRIALWSAAWHLIAANPFGFGYGTGGGPSALALMQHWSGWPGARQAHNAYLATALDLGWPGLFAYLMALARLGLTQLRRSAAPLDRAALALLVLHIALGMAEAGAGPYPTVTVFALLVLFGAARADTAPATKRPAMAETV